MSKKVKKKKRKLKTKAILTFLILIVFLTSIFLLIFTTPITNIYISGNHIFSDEDIIEMAGLKEYPSVLKTNYVFLKNKLEKNKYIRKVKIKKRGLFKQLYLTIYENYPLFSYQNKTYLYDLKTVDENYAVPILINEVPDNIYDEFIKCLRSVDLDILNRISEIKYSPNDVDKKRFYLTMSDGIYVYINLNRFDKINDYDKIAATLESKKGTLYLDSGEYFEVAK